MDNYPDPLLRLSRVKTLQILNEFEVDHKINVSKGVRRGQGHYLSINDQDKFNLIRNELEEIESFIKQTNQYLSRRLEENNQDVELSDSPDKDKRIKYEKRVLITIGLEQLYKQTAHRMLDDLYHVTATSKLSRQDSERFIKQIIELKLKLAYHEWSIDIEKGYFKTQNAGMRKIDRDIKQAGLDDYFEGKGLKDKGLKNKLIEPYNTRVQKFTEFLSLTE
jgi:dihydrofolate reductase